MPSVGFTQVRTIGPIADAVEAAGCSLARIFRKADLPLGLINEPARLFPLKDQLNLLEIAAREIGDEALPARLSLESGMEGLGPYGERIVSAPDLGSAILRAKNLIGSLLQSSSRMELAVSGKWASWTYELTGPEIVGRQRNSVLAIGYMIDLMRRFAGPAFTPAGAGVWGGAVAGRSMVEDVLGCTLSRADKAILVFPKDLLETQSPLPVSKPAIGVGDAGLPALDDMIGCVEKLVSLALIESQPRIAWVARKIDVSPRTLQRRLQALGANYDEILTRVILERGKELLQGSDAPITDIAFALGYSDPAHFSRAFRRWTGASPRAWRSRRGQT